MKQFYLLLLLATIMSSPLRAEEVNKSQQNEKQVKAATIKKPASKTVAAETKVIEVSKSDVNDNLIIKKPVTVIGEEKIIKSKYEDTLLELGRRYNLGYVEMIAANPGVDPWVPGEDTKIILPKRHILPDVPHEGIVINLAEMRMYDFTKDPQNPKTYPLGIGRDGLNTPLGQTTITRKKDGPSWRPTPRMRKENPDLPAVVEPGEDNPLGTHALYLGWPQYLIHGTHKPLGVGRRVSSGCIRMYPEDIIKVFNEIPVGTKVTVVKQPIKFAWIDDMLFMEAHAEDELADTYEDIGTIKEYRVPETLFSDVNSIAGESKDRLDWKKIREAVKTRSGIPIAILTHDEPTEPVEVSEDVLKINYEDTPKVEEKAPEQVKQPKSLNLNS